MKAMNGNEYMSRTVRLTSAKIISMQKRKTHAVMILSALVKGLRVAISRPAKKDCEILI